MTDAKKWRSVMMRVESDAKLAELAKYHKQSKAAFMDWLVLREWQRCFEPLSKENPYQKPASTVFRSRA